MSGGVDSSIAGYLLKKEGYQVQGVHFLLSDLGKKRKKTKEVKKIAKKLSIPLVISDVRKDFKKTVIKHFLEEYQKGRTPNPCVFCNKNFKFAFLFKQIKKQKADFVATGHYARLRREIPNPKSEIQNKSKNPKSKNLNKCIHQLFKAKDKEKDQSYFLYRLNQKKLAKIIFPLGDYKKEEVKKIAQKLKLPIKKKESQDVCFLEKGETGSFLEKELKLTPGKIKNEKGKIIGEHKGVELFTKGQRRNINIGGQGPFYVFEKNMRTGDLWVSNDSKNKKLLSEKFWLSSPSWICQEPKFPSRKLVSLRYHQEPKYAIIKKKNGKLEVELEDSQRAITSGQSAVFYEKNGQVLGGGIIETNKN